MSVKWRKGHVYVTTCDVWNDRLKESFVYCGIKMFLFNVHKWFDI